MEDQLYSERHCSMDGRSWTDLTSNMTFLSEVQLEGYVRRLLVAGKSPNYYRPTFLHEATHHWCFLSPVGSTLAYLQLKVLKQAWRQAALSDEAHDLLEDLIRYEVATALLRPLAEGLALFAQYDATPSFSSVLSTPMQWSLLLFGLDEDLLDPSLPFDSVEQLLRSLLLILTDARLNEQTLRSKLGLLVKPLLPSVDCYLPGYLFVKNLRRFALSKSTRFLDTDLFLTYLRYFFYNDLGLVTALLDPSTSEIKTANAISKAFQERIEQFYNSDLAANVAHFEKEIPDHSTTQTTGFSNLLGMFNDMTTAKLGQERLQALIDEVGNEPVGNESGEIPSDILKKIQGDILRRRAYMRIGSLPVSVSIDNDGKTLISRGDHTFMGLQFPKGDIEEKISLSVNTMTGVEEIKDILHVCGTENVTEGVGEGSMDLYFSVLNTYRACTITREGVLVGSIFFEAEDRDSKAKENERARFMELQRYGMQLEKLNALRGKMLNEILEHSWIKIVLDHVKKQLPGMVDQAYLPISLLFVPDQKLDECIKIMSKRGYYELFGKDRSALEALALLDICCSLLPKRELIAKWLVARNMDLDATIAMLNSYGERYSIPKVIDLDDWLACFI